MAGEPMAGEQNDLLTRYLIFEGTEDLVTWTYVGSQLAKNQDKAKSLFYEHREQNGAAVSVVSESYWKAVRLPLTMPDAPPRPLVGSSPAAPLAGQQRLDDDADEPE